MSAKSDRVFKTIGKVAVGLLAVAFVLAMIFFAAVLYMRHFFRVVF